MEDSAFIRCVWIWIHALQRCQGADASHGTSPCIIMPELLSTTCANSVHRESVRSVMRTLTARAAVTVLQQLQDFDAFTASWLGEYCSMHPPTGVDVSAPHQIARCIATSVTLAYVELSNALGILQYRCGRARDSAAPVWSSLLLLCVAQ